MPDVLIRNVPAEDLDLLDERARRAGLSRTEYLRRHLHSEARRAQRLVTVGDLSALADLVPELDDEAVMGDAWS